MAGLFVLGTGDWGCGIRNVARLCRRSDSVRSLGTVAEQRSLRKPVSHRLRSARTPVQPVRPLGERITVFQLAGRDPHAVSAVGLCRAVRRCAREAKRMWRFRSACIFATCAIYFLYTPFDEWSYLAVSPAGNCADAAVGKRRARSCVDPSGCRASAAPLCLSLLLITASLAIFCVRTAGDRLAFTLKYLEQRYRSAGLVVRDRLPPNAVVLSVWDSGAVRFHGRKEALSWAGLDPAWLDRSLAWLGEHGRTPYILVESWEEPAFRSRFGNDSDIGKLDWPPTVRNRSSRPYLRSEGSGEVRSRRERGDGVSMAAARTISALREHAIGESLFPPTTLAQAIDRLGFVQADPIRSPARAQDLILRHRVRGYHAGDLERHYASLDIEEDYLYAYGFLSKRVWQLLHPRKRTALGALEKKVLDTVMKLGEAHPRALEAHLGKRRVVNAWGGYSKATTHALEWLHWRGLLRIARREKGIRVYRPSSLPDSTPPRAERLRSLIMVYARIFAPSPEKSLQSVIARHRDLGNTRTTLRAMTAAGELHRDVVDGVSYLWPEDASEHASLQSGTVSCAVRPCDLGSRAIRAPVGLGVSLRGVHAGEEARARLLRDADAVGQRRDWLGQRGHRCRRTRRTGRLYQRTAPRRRVPARARCRNRAARRISGTIADLKVGTTTAYSSLFVLRFSFRYH